MKVIRPDIIILDLHMPDKTGFDFMDIVRKDRLLAKSKVIMLTADNTVSNMLKADYKGIDALRFLGKPFNISELQALVLDLSLLH
jgi:CheY-like chemotaxis protein